jgi:hypothetical protein
MDLVVLDHRVRQQPISDLVDLIHVGLAVGAFFDIELEALPLTYRPDAGHPEPWERREHRATLRIQDFGLEHDLDDDPHALIVGVAAIGDCAESDA